MENINVPSCSQLKSLTGDSEEFINRAARKLSKRSKAIQQIDFLKVRKMWNNNRSIEQIYDSLWPKLQKAEEEAKGMQAALNLKKETALLHGSSVTGMVENRIAGYESRINELDDLSNDCRQILFDAKKEISRLLAEMRFNCEVISQRVKEQPHTPEKPKVLPTQSTSPSCAATVDTASSDCAVVPIPVSSPVECLSRMFSDNDAVVAAAVAAAVASTCDSVVENALQSSNTSENSSSCASCFDVDGPAIAVWQGNSARSPMVATVPTKRERAWSLGDSCGLATVLTGTSPIGTFSSSPQGSPTQQARKGLANYSSGPGSAGSGSGGGMQGDQPLSPFSTTSSSSGTNSHSSSSSSSPVAEVTLMNLQGGDNVSGDGRSSSSPPLYLNLSPVTISPIPFPVTPPGSPTSRASQRKIIPCNNVSETTAPSTMQTEQGNNNSNSNAVPAVGGESADASVQPSSCCDDDISICETVKAAQPPASVSLLSSELEDNWNDNAAAEARRQALLANSVDLRSISFTLQDNNIGHSLVHPSSCVDVPMDAQHAPHVRTFDESLPVVTAAMEHRKNHHHHRERPAFLHHESSQSSSTPTSHRRTPTSVDSRRDVERENSFRVDEAIHKMLSEYPDAVAKAIVLDPEHQLLCAQLKRVAETKIKLQPIQQSLASCGEIESAKLNKIKRHRSELESFCQAVSNDGTNNGSKTPTNPNGAVAAAGAGGDVTRLRSGSASSSSASSASMWSNSPICAGTRQDRKNKSKDKDKDSSRRTLARRFSKKILSVFSPKQAAAAAAAAAAGEAVTTTGSRDSQLGNLSSARSLTSTNSSNSLLGYHDPLASLKSPSHSLPSLALPKSESMGSDLSENSGGAIPLHHSMLRTLSGSQVTSRDISSGSSADCDCQYGVRNTPTEGTESCDSSDDPDFQAIKSTRECIGELKMLIEQQKQASEYAFIVNNLVSSVAQAQKQLLQDKEQHSSPN